jgi:hypothetical protein
MDRWTMHDLRRTARTLLSKAKIKKNGVETRIDFFVAEAILGHALGGVAGIYNRDNYAAEIPAALAALADHIHQIVGDIGLVWKRRRSGGYKAGEGRSTYIIDPCPQGGYTLTCGQYVLPFSTSSSIFKSLDAVRAAAQDHYDGRPNSMSA